MNRTAASTGIAVIQSAEGNGLIFFVFDGERNQTADIKLTIDESLTLCANIIRTASKATDLSVSSLIEGVLEESRIEPEDDSRCSHCGGVC